MAASIFAAATIVLVALVLSFTLNPAAGDTATYDDPLDRFPSDDRAQGSGQVIEGAPDVGRNLERFLPFVVSDVQSFWAHEFRRAGLEYRPARVVVFDRAVVTACGPASSETGPFYCPADTTVYLDPGFFRELAVEFRAPGDFAQAYVIAHEIGHHVQTLTGITQQVTLMMRRDPENRNEWSIRLELQADCLAGVWGHSTYERGLLERGDLDEALRAAAAVGDDRIQRRTMGRVDPENWTHGSAEQRRTWYLRGFQDGDPNACDTFADAA